MPRLIIIDRAGHETPIEAREGNTVMEAIRENGFDELQALCGGSCSCATCHIIIGDDWVQVTGVASEDENELLEGSDYRSPHSRLSCQVLVTAATDGLRVTIAPED